MRHPGADRADDAVSPVVGVVLLVGIAVTVMGAIGVFVLGFGPGGSVPHAEFIFAEEENSNVTVTVSESGDGLLEQDVVILVGPDRACTDDGAGDQAWQGTGPLELGEEVTVSHYGSDCNEKIGSGDLLRVVWESPTSSRQVTLAEWEVP